MTVSNDRDYLERRMRESNERAQSAADPAIARVHREFAEGYARLLEAGETIRIVPAQ